MKRSLDIAFPDMATDVDLCNGLHWRSGNHCDLKLRVGPKSFKCHKILLSYGPRASAFVNRATLTQIGTNRCDATGEDSAGGMMVIDLGQVLLETLWEVIEATLDYIYTGDVSVLRKDHLLKFLACAEILQIPALYEECSKLYDDFPEIQTAPSVLGDVALSSVRGEVGEQIKSKCVDCIAHNFRKYTADDLMQIPIPILSEILRDPVLAVLHEDEVCDAVLDQISRRGDEAAELWNSCNLRRISLERMGKAKDIMDKGLLLDLLTRGETECSAHYPLIDINCLIIFEDLHTIQQSRVHPKCIQKSEALRAQLARAINERGGHTCFLPSYKPIDHTSVSFHPFGDDIDVILLCNVAPYNDGHPYGLDEDLATQIRHLVDDGCGLITIRSHPVDAVDGDPQLGIDYEPLIIQNDDHKPGAHRKETIQMRRPVNVTIPAEVSAELMHGICLDDWYHSASLFSKKLKWEVTAKLSPGAHVLIERERDSIPVFAVHPRKNIASLWDKCMKGSALFLSCDEAKELKPHERVLLNTILRFGQARLAQRTDSPFLRFR